jgi:hypothetical protein
MRHLAAICSRDCELATTNSTCLVAAGDFASGRTTSTCRLAHGVLNQLPRRDRHGAVGIDFHDDS